VIERVEPGAIDDSLLPAPLLSLALAAFRA